MMRRQRAKGSVQRIRAAGSTDRSAFTHWSAHYTLRQRLMVEDVAQRIGPHR